MKTKKRSLLDFMGNIPFRALTSPATASYLSTPVTHNSNDAKAALGAARAYTNSRGGYGF